LQEHLDDLMSACQADDDLLDAENAVESAFAIVAKQEKENSLHTKTRMLAGSNKKASKAEPKGIPVKRGGKESRGDNAVSNSKVSKEQKIYEIEEIPMAVFQDPLHPNPDPNPNPNPNPNPTPNPNPNPVFQDPLYPVPDDRALDIPCDDGGAHGSCGLKMISKVYQYITKMTRLDWGLGSNVGAIQGQRICRADSIASLQNTYHGARVIDESTYTGGARLEAVKEKIAENEAYDPSHTGTRGSEGYGETTISSNTKIFSVLRNMRKLVLDKIKPAGHGDLDSGWDCDHDSTFLDIGSGYGKMNFHAKVMCDVHRSVGIECVFSRYQMADSMLENIRSDTMVLIPEYKKHLAKQAHSEIPAETDQGAYDSNQISQRAVEEVVEATGVGVSSEQEKGSLVSSAKTKGKGGKKDLSLEEKEKRRRDVEEKIKDEMRQLAGVHEGFSVDGIVFKHADCTVEANLSYSHIYTFDRVFSRLTMKALAPLLQASDFRVLVSSRHWREWWGFGLSKVQPVAKIRLSTTGKEKVTAYVYINSELFPRPTKEVNCDSD